MNKKKRHPAFAASTALVLCLTLALAPNAYATDLASATNLKWYVGAKLPIMFIDDTESKTSGTVPAAGVTYSSEATVEYDTGFRLSGILGYQVSPNIRVEGELFYGKAKVDKLTYKGVGYSVPNPQNLQGPPLSVPVPGSVDGGGSGSPKQLGAMVNVWYDFNSASKWTPYAGLGLGFIRVDLANLKYNDNAVAQSIVNNNPGIAAALTQQNLLVNGQLIPGFVPKLSQDTDTALAWQFGAGVGYEMSDNVVLDLGYRYQSTGTLEFKGQNQIGTLVSEQKLKVHLIEVGIRYRF